MEIKVITGKTDKLDILFNDWVNKHPGLVIHQISTTGTDADYHGIHLTVLYKEQKDFNHE